MYARGRFRCARSATLEGLRGVTRNVTRFGKHNYMRPGSVACRCVDTYETKERKREKQKEKEKRRTLRTVHENIEPLKKYCPLRDARTRL